MEATREDLQRALSALGPRGRGKRYPKQLLEQLLRYTVAKRREGLSLKAISEELGLSFHTLANWLGARRFRRVEVVQAQRREAVEVAQAPRREVVVHGPSGLR